LSECFGFVGIGSYADGQIAGSAITASSAELFATIPTPRLLGNSEAEPIRKALVALTPRRLDSTRHLRILSVQLEGQDLIVLQRAFAEADYTSKAAKERLKYIFAIGIAARDGVHILHWKKNTDDECESVLGTIRLKSGRDFLVTSVSDPESQSFRVYGIRDGHLALVYSGGGWSC
jgi:hypothetical protein